MTVICRARWPLWVSSHSGYSMIPCLVHLQHCANLVNLSTSSPVKKSSVIASTTWGKLRQHSQQPTFRYKKHSKHLLGWVALTKPWKYSPCPGYIFQSQGKLCSLQPFWFLLSRQEAGEQVAFSFSVTFLSSKSLQGPSGWAPWYLSAEERKALCLADRHLIFRCFSSTDVKKAPCGSCLWRTLSAGLTVAVQPLNITPYFRCQKFGCQTTAFS